MSPRSRRIGFPVALATGLGLAALACSSNSARPAELGDCVKTGDASCPAPVVGGGGGGPGDGGGASDGDGGQDAVASCGTAQNLLSTQNASCAPCVEAPGGTGCCGADQACSAQAACLTVLQCMVSCSPNDVTCADNCENATPAGVQAYNQFAQCIAQSCSPQCPTLPKGGIGDL